MEVEHAEGRDGLDLSKIRTHTNIALAGTPTVSPLVSYDFFFSVCYSQSLRSGLVHRLTVLAPRRVFSSLALLRPLCFAPSAFPASERVLSGWSDLCSSWSLCSLVPCARPSDLARTRHSFLPPRLPLRTRSIRTLAKRLCTEVPAAALYRQGRNQFTHGLRKNIGERWRPLALPSFLSDSPSLLPCFPHPAVSFHSLSRLPLRTPWSRVAACFSSAGLNTPSPALSPSSRRRPFLPQLVPPPRSPRSSTRLPGSDPLASLSASCERLLGPPVPHYGRTTPERDDPGRSAATLVPCPFSPSASTPQRSVQHGSPTLPSTIFPLLSIPTLPRISTAYVPDPTRAPKPSNSFLPQLQPGLLSLPPSRRPLLR